ncbi:MAG: hypothetical protein NZZ41_05775 [Candidatus Dojkabacteria bacterium]|nr:hypothetical protein [Candidatus Dojkabacteria bacterium]
MSSRSRILQLIDLIRKKENSNVVQVLGILVLGLVLLSLVTVPTLSSLGKNIRENQLRQELIKKQEKKIQDLQNLENKLQIQKNYIDYFEQSFPDVTNFNQEVILEFLLNRIKANQIKLLYLNFSEISQNNTSSNTNFITGLNSKVNSINFSLNLTGEKQNILNFLSDLQKNTRIYKVDSFTIKKNLERNEFEGYISGTIFYWLNETK